MSSERGNVRKAPPRHQNSFKFRHNPNSKKTAQIMKTPIEGLCKRCTDKLEWKKNYRKYKPLTTPRKCTRCEQKTVYRAYHIVCEKCATDLKICAKCCDRGEITSPFVKANQEQQDDKILASLSERKRRTYLRMLERGHTPKIGPNGEITIEIHEEGSDEESDEDGDKAEGDASDDASDDLSEDDAPPKPKSAKPAAAPKKTAASTNKANNTKDTKEQVKEESDDEDEEEDGEEGSMESFDEDVLDSDDEDIVDQVKEDHKQRKQV
eukprot:TRINITY_DN15156_c0_g1_i1.p1 TRINITY_DN15156_c0_g1~~TRINITY_DN15156_c0_g1_i1.p1  ORF type:complete len:266 (-),score=76.50 TRINITY_DN15156_c0_g1_i1:9-806(-)